MSVYIDSLRGYGHNTHVKHNFMCVYCGFDGRAFSNWLQLSIDHVLPQSQGGNDVEENKVTCCQQCNSMTSRMKFEPGFTTSEIIEKKRAYVKESRAELFEFWLQSVAPHYLGTAQEK